jgi:hypothetical protein
MKQNSFETSFGLRNHPVLATICGPGSRLESLKSNTIEKQSRLMILSGPGKTLSPLHPVLLFRDWK